MLAFQDALLRLLERRAAIYTMGDSTSLPAHTAAELLRSVCFVLGIDPEDGNIPDRLFGVNLEDEYRRRLSDVEREVKAAMQLWCDVDAAMPPIPSVALRDSLAAIGDFFKAYDFRSMAHDIPCMIDYPLCHPVDESLLGIDYISEYLRRLKIETYLLRRFDIGRCETVLSSASPDFVDLLVNLYEPVATNVVGLALIDEDPAALIIGDAHRRAIAEHLGPLRPDDRARVLLSAATRACDLLGVEDGDGRDYLCELVSDLLPRIEIGLEHGTLNGIFVS
jgi:hypothetical protein